MTFAAVVAVLALAAPAAARDDGKDHQHHHGQTEKLGTVTFPTSCAPGSQAPFTRAVALLHSFWYGEAEKAFNEVVTSDPSCAIAWWGVAMSNYHPIWAAPSEAEFARGREAVAKAVAAGAKTEREKDYIAAMAAYFNGGPDHPARAAAYQKAMESLAARYPDDREASIFHALALLGTASPADKTYAIQRKAGEILNRVLPLQPDHPGVAHYLIHSFDYPALADLALPAARSYSRIAESSPHALHMPSHIFVRLGLWDDAIRSNEESAAAALAHVRKSDPGGSSFDELHALDYLEYAFLQQGKTDKAREILARVRAVKRLDNPQFAAAYAMAAVPARFTIERGQWKEAAALSVEAPWFPWDKHPNAESITWWARGIGAARSGDVPRAKEAVARIAALHDAAVAMKMPYWPDQIEIQRREAAAWVAHAEGKKDEALALMNAAVELEASTEKHPVTPGPVLPARELLGDMLMENGRREEARAAYVASLAVAPHRLYPTARMGVIVSAKD
jgi:tetratricopeptide (TPR) repeat protein